MISRIASGRRLRARPRPRFTVTLSDEHRAWVVDNALRGVDRVALTSTLIDGGVPAPIAAAEVDAILRSPALAGCAWLQRRVARLEMVASLLRAVARQAPNPGVIERRPGVAADEFFERYWAASRPVVLTDVIARWPARARWTPAFLKERYGEVEVEIMSGRDTDPESEHRFEAHREMVKLADFVDKVLSAGHCNDVYLVARNRNLDRPELKSLFDDVAPPDDLFDPKGLHGGSSFWFGPAGTLTPLHHDTTNILFGQIYGRKRVDLVAPIETALLDGARDFYAGARADALGEAQVGRVELAPGEALFIPAGWWHEVTALEVSINFSLLNFRRPNDLSWYRPGAV